MSDEEIKIHTLQETVAHLTAERNQLHASLTDHRLHALEKMGEDHETRLRIAEAIGTRFNTIYALFAGNGLMSVIILVKLFAESNQ